MNDIVVKSNLKEMKQNPERGEKRDELREGNSLGVSKSSVLVGKLGKKGKGVAEREEKKGAGTAKGLRKPRDALT